MCHYLLILMIRVIIFIFFIQFVFRFEDIQFSYLIIIFFILIFYSILII